MNNTLQRESVDYFMRLNRLLGPLWHDLQKLFPRVELAFSRYDETVRLLPEEYKAAVWRYNKLGLGESIEQLNELSIEPVANDLRKLKPQIEGISLEGITDSIRRLDNMLDRCTRYTSEVDIFDESGVFVNVVGGIDELRSILHDLWDIVVGLKPSVVNQNLEYVASINHGNQANIASSLANTEPIDLTDSENGKIEKPIESAGTTFEPPKQRQRRPSTVARENRLKDLVENYMRVEGKARPEAMALAAEKEGVQLDTVERALGLRKR